MKIKRKQKKRKAAVLQALEPRLLFSADVFGGAIDISGTDDPLANILDEAAAALDLSKAQVDHFSDQTSAESNEPPADETGRRLSSQPQPIL